MPDYAAGGGGHIELALELITRGGNINAAFSGAKAGGHTELASYLNYVLRYCNEDQRVNFIRETLKIIKEENHITLPQAIFKLKALFPSFINRENNTQQTFFRTPGSDEIKTQEEELNDNLFRIQPV